MSQLGLFDIDNRLQAISDLKDSLEILQSRVPWDVFRKDLNRALRKEKKIMPVGNPLMGYLCSKSLCCKACMACRIIRWNFKSRIDSPSSVS